MSSTGRRLFRAWFYLQIAAVLFCVFLPGTLVRRQVPERGISEREIPRLDLPAREQPRTLPERIHAVVVPEEDLWLVPVAAPVCARLREGDRTPFLVVSPGSPSDGTKRFFTGLAPNRVLVLASLEGEILADTLGLDGCRIVETGTRASEAGVMVAVKFWPSGAQAVSARIDDGEGMVLGATLAGHQNMPFIPIGEEEALHEVRKGTLSRFDRVHFVSCGKGTGGWTAKLRKEDELLDRDSVQRRIVERLDPERIRNIIVTRIPGNPSPHAVSWALAPYLSILRRAPVLVCHSGTGDQVESSVWSLVSAGGLRPETITILADYETIGTRPFRNEATLGEYEVDIEPCSHAFKGFALGCGVGRIPKCSAVEASMLLAHTLLKERGLHAGTKRIVVIANPASTWSALPLCETISRATAEEFKNCGFDVAEFYGRAPDDPGALDEVERAHLIIYEGHLADQLLFEDPIFIPEPQTDGIIVKDDGCLPAPLPENAGLRFDSQYSYSGTTASLGKPCVADEPVPNRTTIRLPRGPLRGLPLVFLQSCSSLDLPQSERIFRRGGTAVVGTTSSVHSGSGSAFAKAFSDRLLYGGATAGEALRDAKNYFLCLMALKEAREHKQMAKGYRVAYSFRLLGDPEMKVLPEPKAFGIRPISAAFSTLSSLRFSSPSRRLKDVQTDAYSLRAFPGTQVAGVVRRVKGRSYRRLSRMHFHRLDIPERFRPYRYTTLERRGERGPHAVFLIDEFLRYVYALYSPEKDAGNMGRILRFKSKGRNR